MRRRGELLGAATDNPRWRGQQQEEGGERDRGVVVVERPRRAELQRAAEAAVDRMAARRHFPKVEIYVPAPRAPLAENRQREAPAQAAA